MNKCSANVALLLNSDSIYETNIIKGIGEYISDYNIDWDIYIPDSFSDENFDIFSLNVDGIITNCDNKQLLEVLPCSEVPVVGISSSKFIDSYASVKSRIVLDNYSAVDMSFKHLEEKGIENYAYYGVPYSKSILYWDQEREIAFRDILSKSKHSNFVYKGHETDPEYRQRRLDSLTEWVTSLPKPVGIIAATEHRAHEIIQVCKKVEILVPEDVLVIYIGEEQGVQYLSDLTLSSVKQSTKLMGYEAAKMLRAIMSESPVINIENVIVSGSVLQEGQSTDHKPIKDPYVVKALHYIRTKINGNIKVCHVLDELRLSRTNLDCRFKKETGNTIHNTIHQERLKLACSLLERANIPLDDVQRMCGFSSLQYMYSVFSRDMGVTPKQYRNGANK